MPEAAGQLNMYLNYYVPKILDMVDECKIAFTIAVELSYL